MNLSFTRRRKEIHFQAHTHKTQDIVSLAWHFGLKIDIPSNIYVDYSLEVKPSRFIESLSFQTTEESKKKGLLFYCAKEMRRNQAAAASQRKLQ